MSDTPRYWFRAKRYGWGWGLPATWEGWVTLGVFLAVTVGAPVVFGDGALAVTIIEIAALGGLILLCAIKGEPPKWRWGGRD